MKTKAAKRLLTAGRYVGTQEWFLGMPEEKQRDYLAKKPCSTFKPVHKEVRETNADSSKKQQTKLRKRAEKHLDNKTGLSTAAAPKLAKPVKLGKTVDGKNYVWREECIINRQKAEVYVVRNKAGKELVALKNSRAAFEYRPLESSTSTATARLREIATGRGPAIGDLCKLKKPIGGYSYFHCTGFAINKNKQGLGPMGLGDGRFPFAGAQIDGIIGNLKPTPLATNDYGPKKTIKLEDIDTVLDARSRQLEIQEYRDKQPLAVGSVVRFNGQLYTVKSGPHYDTPRQRKTDTASWYVCVDKSGVEHQISRAALEFMYGPR
jgi:hypothetical protein